METEDGVVIDARTAAVIVAGMQAMALADGDEHPEELKLIAAFRAEIPEDVDPAGLLLTDDAVRRVFVRSLVMVGMADGRLSPPERQVAIELAQAHGAAGELVAELEREVSREMLAHFRGVTLYRDHALQVAASLGIDPSEAERILSEEI